MIILDLEWNRGYDKKPIEEILHIGAVKIDHLGGPIVDTFNSYIKPVIHAKMDIGARKLPQLDDYRELGTTFPRAMKAFRAWCGDEKEFGSWGGDDRRAIDQNCKYYRLPTFEMPVFHDLQRAYCHAVGADGQQIALWRAVDYHGIPDIFCYHDALHDAMYTALVCQCLLPEDLAWKPVKIKRGRRNITFSSIPYPKQPRRRIGPFADPVSGASDRTARKPCCPICGEAVGISRWSYDPKCKPGQQVYYAPFRCTEHGYFLTRLTMAEMEDGTWWGRVTVPPLSEETVRQYTHIQQGETLICRAAPNGKRRRRPRKKRSKKNDE